MRWWPFRVRPEPVSAGDVRAAVVTGDLDRAMREVKRSMAKLQQIAAEAAGEAERENGGGHPAS